MNLLSEMLEKQKLEHAGAAPEAAESREALLEAHEAALKDPFFEFRRKTRPEAQPPERTTAELREVDTLSANISRRLAKEGVDAAHWAKATEIERNDMMDKTFRIMVEEMRLPEDVTARVMFTHVGTGENVAGTCKLFVMRDAAGALVRNPDVRPEVEMHYGLMYQDDFFLPLRSIAHQAALLMEQSCVTEPAGAFADEPLRAAWTKEVESEIDGTRAGVDGSMQLYARKFEDHLIQALVRQEKYGAAP